MEEQGRNNKGGIHKKLQDIYLICSPNLRGYIGFVNVDLDFPSLFHQYDSRTIGGIERKGKLFKVNNGGERVGRRSLLFENKRHL
jgi:hypothetical protein